MSTRAVVDGATMEIPSSASTAVRPDAAPRQLSDAEKAEVRELRARDREVRAHEQAHTAAGGGNTRGGPSYTYERGPDGQSYAVAGEVDIDTSPVAGDPEATARKMEQIQRAASAPSEPSSQDRQVAAQAAATASRARAEASAERRDATAEPGRLVDVLA